MGSVVIYSAGLRDPVMGNFRSETR
jgi:hypothetical protein